MKTLRAVLGAAILAAPSLQHVAIKPPSGDKALTPNSSTAPPGCKLLASDKGWPSDEEWLKAFPKGFKKMKGTEGPDWWVQPQTVKEVQAAVNFAREHNVRLSVITSGHDFHARGDTRSGLRIDLGAFMEPTVFSNEWTCGTTLKPTTATGRVVDDILSCKVRNDKRNVGRSIPGRQYDWHFFEKRSEQDSCDTLVPKKLRMREAADPDGGMPTYYDQDMKVYKRHGPDDDEEKPKTPKTPKTPLSARAADPPKAKFDTKKPWEWAVNTGFKLPPNAQYVENFNVIKPVAGKQAYARVSAAMSNEMFYTQAAKSGLMTLGAQHGGVGVIGGWMQAGGHNPFANRFGMQVDNVVEIEVVTPDGVFQKASECQNSELFWALRGGGGGTFGVVTAATVKVHPTFPVVVTRFMVNTTGMYDPRMFEATAHFLQQGAKLRDQYGLMGYFYVYPNGFHSALHLPDKAATLANAKAVTTKIMGEMEKIAGGPHIEPKYYEYKTYRDWYIAEYGDEDMEDAGTKFLSWYDGSWGDCPSGPEVMMNPMLALPYKLRESQIEQQQAAAAAKAKNPKLKKRDQGSKHSVLRTQPMSRTYLDSRLLSDKMVNSISLKQLADAVNGTFPRLFANHIRGFLYGGGKMTEPRPDDMGLLPAWRTMTYHFIVNAGPGSSRHDYNIRVWDKYFPDAGAYINEAAPGEPKWKEKFFGSHYARLEQIKKKVDPKNVLWCSPCVGADMLSYDDERICPNPKYPQAGESPQTYRDDKSKAGIASLPGEEGIPNPLMPIIQTYMVNKTLPKTMPASNYFKMAMGQGGSSGGKWSFGNKAAAKGGAAGAMTGMEHGHGNMA